MPKILKLLLLCLPIALLGALLFFGAYSPAGAEWDGTASTFGVSDPEPLEGGNSGWDGTASTFGISDPQPITACSLEFRYPECDSAGPGWVHEVWQGSDCNLFPQNIHFQGGVCGHSFEAPTPAQSQPAVQTAACSLTQVDQYPQCGGTVGLFNKDPGHVFEVTKFRDSCSGEETFSPRDVGVQENRREYPQCGGTIGLERFPATDTIIVEEFTNVCSGGKRFSVVRNAGNLGQCQTVPQPAIQPPVGAPQPVTVIVATPTPAPVVVTPTAAPIPTIVPTVTPVPTVVVVNAQVRCPDGFVRTISNSNIICLQQIQNQTQSVVSTSNASTGPINVSLAGIPQGVPAQIVPMEVKQPVVFTQELPKTGLPLVAWAFSGLAPVGLKMKKFGASKTAGNAILALWQEREYLKN